MEICTALIDDSAVPFKLMSQYLSSRPNVKFIDGVTDGEKLEEFLKKQKVDVMFVDLCLSYHDCYPAKPQRRDGIQLIKDLKPIFPDVKFVLLTGNKDAALLNRAFNNGASGYLLKSNIEDLPQVIELVYYNNGFCDFDMGKQAGIKENLIGKDSIIDRDTRYTELKITYLERDVLILIVEGLTDQEISEKIATLKGLKENAAAIRRSLREKFGVKNTASLITFAYRNNLLD